MKRLTLALVALFSVGCSDAFVPMSQLNIHPDTPPDMVQAAIEARDAWCSFHQSACVPVAISDKNDGGMLKSVTKGGPCSGVDFGRTRLSVIKAPVVRMCSGKESGIPLATRVAHELGHALAGAKYHDAEASVMKALIKRDAETQFNENDLAYIVGVRVR